MTPISTANPRPLTQRLDGAAPRANPSPEDVQALRHALAKADPSQPQPAAAGPKTMGKMGKAGADALAPKLKPEQQASQPEAGSHEEEAQFVRGREHDHGRADAESERDARQDAQPGLVQLTPQATPMIAMPAMPAPQVDPSAFAQLLTQLWLRERGKGAKEVRVSFGADAWPATGARLVRNAGGALDVQLHIAATGSLDGEKLEGLRGQLADQGLAIGALQLETGTLA
jgi:hypothetical protein